MELTGTDIQMLISALNAHKQIMVRRQAQYSIGTLLYNAYIEPIAHIDTLKKVISS